MEYSVFEKINFVSIDKNKKVTYLKELIFYHGRINPDTKNDWRFKEVPNKRKELILLGYCNIELPVVYPLILDSGIEIISNNITYTE